MPRNYKKKRKLARARAILTVVLPLHLRTYVANKASPTKRTLMDWDERLQLSEKEFTRRYRLNKQKFKYVSALLSNQKQAASKYHRGWFWESKKVSTDLKLSMTLRWLAGGDYKDVGDLHGVEASNTFYKHVWSTISALIKEPELDLPLMREGGAVGPDLLPGAPGTLSEAI